MSIGKKLAFWIVSILLVITAATIYAFYSFELSQEVKNLELFGGMAGRVIEESLVSSMRTRNTTALNERLKDLKKNTEMISAIWLVDRDGTVGAGTDQASIGAKLTAAEGHPGGVREGPRHGTLLADGNTYRWAQPVKNRPECHRCHGSQAEYNGTVIIDFTLTDVIQQVRRKISGGAAIMLVASSSIGIFMLVLSNRLIGRRLRPVVDTVRLIKEDAYEVKAVSRGRDEFSGLEEDFNVMAEVIQTRDREKENLVKQLSAINEELRNEIGLRKRWEAMQREQKMFSESLIQRSATATFVMGPDHRIILWNKACEELTGIPAPDMVGTSNQWKAFYPSRRQTLADIVLEGNIADLPELYEIYSNSALVAKGLHAEGWYERLNGRDRYIIFDAAPIYDSQDATIAVVETLQDITERKQLEQKLAQSESRLRAIIDTEPECVTLIAADGTLLEMNPAGLAMIEAESFGQVEGRQISSLVVPEHRSLFEALTRNAFRGESDTLEFELVGLKGTRRALEIHTAPLRNAQEQIFAVLGVTRDITERKRAEQVIKKTYDTQTAINWILHISLEKISLEAILKQTLVSILSIPWLSVEARGSIFLVEGVPNKLVMKVQRGLSEQLQEKCKIVPFGKCLCGRAADRGEVQFADSLDERHEIRYAGIASHGHYCVPIMHGKTVLGVINMYLKEGHPRDEKEIEFLSAMASALAGIIQRKRAEEEREKLIVDLRDVLNTVSRSQKEWQLTFDSIKDMIALVDPDLRIIKANRAFSAYIGLTPQQVIGRKINELLPLTDPSESTCLYGEDPETDRPVTCEVLDPRTNKVFLTSTFLFPSPEGKHLGRIYIAKDVTDEKEKERRFMLNERLAALGQMASGIAHEINNPLASIAGCSEGLLARARKGQWDLRLFENYLGIIQEEVFRCKSITTAMLSFVRKTTYEKKDIVLTDMIDKTIEIIGFQGRLKNVDIVRRYQGQQQVIHGNEGELRQVMLAVITNALDAMDDKGTLTIETEAREGGFDVRVTDTGPGISPEIISRIFDPFFTTKSEKGGTGLGLSIARKIVMNHNGNIDVLSESGQGATINIMLPL